jgi:hypothetical protein
LYLPSTMLASGNAASMVGASDSAGGAGTDSSAACAGSSSATLRRVHPHPRSSPSISCRVHNWLSTQYNYQTKCTTREGSSLTSLTGQPSRLGRRGCWQCRPVQPRQALPLAPQ